MTQLTKVLVADDHVLIRDGLKHSLQTIDQKVEVIEAKNGIEVSKHMETHYDIAIVLLDLYMPDTDGFQLLSNLCDRYPDIPIIVLSAAEEQGIMRKVLDCGASGFIPKSTSHEVMLSAINLVLSGGIYIPPGMLNNKKNAKPIDQNLLTNAQIQNLDEPDLVLARAKLEQLTERQKEVLSLMAKGMQNKEIARSLDLSEHTVKIHVTAILKTLNVTNRTQAVLHAQRF